MKKAKIYIASPYSVGDVEANVERQLATASLLIDAGCNPYAPLLNHYIHIRWQKMEEVWLSLDFEWVTVCDALYRLQGYSAGADKEVELAKSKNIPVLYSMEEVLDFIWQHKQKQIKKEENNAKVRTLSQKKEPPLIDGFVRYSLGENKQREQESRFGNNPQ